jgi:hypothetical protein
MIRSRPEKKSVGWRVRPSILTFVLAGATTTLFFLLGACGSTKSGGASPDGGGGDTGPGSGDAHAADGRSPSDGATTSDSSQDGPANDAGDGGMFDAGDSGCKDFDGGPYVALQWNEICSSTITNFLVEWGDTDGGPYPNVADAGDPCDAGVCAKDASAELVCRYDLRGLDAGSYCIVTVACDGTECSTPSGQACVTIPAPCK